MFKKVIAILAILAVSMPYCALAATSTNNNSNGAYYGSSTSLYNVVDFKFHHQPYGIGYGNCPVYTAPSKSAFRCANGKASVDTNADMWIGGLESGGWLLVRYETSNGGVRVGYIPPDNIKGFKTSIDNPKFSYIAQTATSYISVTDNPLNANSSFAMLYPGETYYILGKYTYYGNWWYIECGVDGQIARGFINRDTTAVNNGSGSYSTDIGEPSLSPYGGRKIGTIQVQGSARIVRQNAGQGYNMVARVAYPEKYPAYDSKIGTNGKTWYYIYVDGVWGWISDGVCNFLN